MDAPDASSGQDKVDGGKFRASGSSVKDLYTVLNCMNDGKRDARVSISAHQRGEQHVPLGPRLRATSVLCAGLRVSMMNKPRSLFSLAHIPVSFRHPCSLAAATTLLQSQMFSQYQIETTSGTLVRFQVHLHSLVQCLSVLGTGPQLDTTSVVLRFSTERAMLSVELTSGSCKVHCEIASLDDGTHEDPEEALFAEAVT
jgi:hypothetical protein